MSGMRCFHTGMLAVGAALLAVAATAQTTGRITGLITDESGAVLPGVTVGAKSSSLQGVRTAVSDGSGSYRLSLLPPGTYEVVFSLQGFGTETRKPVTVGLGKELALDVTLRPTLADQITVSGEAPVVEVTSTSVGSNISSRAITSLPTGRNYSSIAQIAPGTSSDANPENKGQSTITVYGSSGAENSYYIDGVNTTNLEYGTQGKELNFEFIAELDIKTGGYEAEYGRSTGGIINVITKSGGNEFRGDVFAYYDSDSLQASADPVVSTGGTVRGFTKEDYGFDLGGYLVKDRLWFFVAYDRVEHSTDSELPGGPLAGQTVQSDSTRDLGSAKLTVQLAAAHSLVATFFRDPREDTGAINDANHTLNGDPLTYEGLQEYGGDDLALRYDGVFGGSWALTAQAARHQEQNSVGPVDASGDTVQYRDAAANYFQTGGFGLIQEKDFTRTHYAASLARFLNSHELKVGLEYEQSEAEVMKRMSGGQRVDVFANSVHPDRPIYYHQYWSTPDATVDNAPLSSLVASPEHQVTTAYVQDRWRVAPQMTLNVGVRWDRQEIIDASGTRQIDLQDDFAPRVGFIWDPTAEHRSKIFGSYGKYFEELPMDLVIRSFSYERQPRIINYDPTSIQPDPDAEADFGTPSGILGGFTEPSDPDLRGQYVQEILLGAEYEILPDVAVGIKGIYRDYGRVIEDFLCINDGTYCIGNPSEGIMRQVYGLDYETLYDAPRPVRIFRGVQLDATKRFSGNWQAMASYLYSKLEGNFDGEYAPFTNVGADPNISAAYDYYDFFTDGRDLTTETNRGPLSNDRRHQFKVSGLYQTPFNLTVGVSAYYRTGTPLTRYGYSDAYGRYEFFLTKRGGEGRNPASYEADVHLGYPLQVGPVTVNVLLDVFNLLNAQRPILLDQRWGFQEADNAESEPANPGYGEAILRTPPTSARLGVRVSF